ncbi:tyrosine-protein phosphatase 99A-like isoform X3 [Penaeus indicus]|uniref:tyrosine-protein phosphatase 99A-like isoform X3 n=1 Tax=Penaeus indicus TaxID=29960 RepID=UPI00300DBC9C
MDNRRHLLLLLAACLFISTHGQAGAPTVTRAGGNVTLACPAARDTYVLLLEWRCRGCELPSDPVAPHEVSLVEYRSESVTLFHHDSRMSLNPTNYSLSFRPVLASDSGTYVCRVNNRDDSELPIKLIVQGEENGGRGSTDVPDPPGRPLILGFTARSVNLSWTPSQDTHNSPISHYIIHIREGEDGHWDVDNGHATTNNSTQFTVDGLSPFTVYSFRVVAVNSLGMSSPSKESYYMVTLRELPEGKPIFTAAHNASSTSLQLHWKPPSRSTIHGEFLGYKITLKPRDVPDARQDQIVRVTIKDPTVTNHVVQDLRTYTQYLVSLQVFNPEGDGPSSTVAVMTDEGIPGPPENLTLLRVHDRSVDLQWSQPSEPNGEIRGYRVYYMQGNYTSVRTVHANEPNILYSLHDLTPNTNFKVWTKAFTQRHEGTSSVPLTVKTDVSGPGAPVISNLTCQPDGNLYLQWLRPAQLFGSVDLYYIYYRPEDSFEFEEIAVNSVNNRLEHNFLLTNLTYNTMYEVKVRGGTYSRLFADNNKTYKGPFSQPRKILLYPDCHNAPPPDVSRTGLEMSAGIIAGIICATFAIFLLVVAMIIWRRFFQGAYYYLDDPPKAPPVLMHDWENDTGGDGAYGPIDVHDFAKHIAELHADGDIAFSKEYEAIQAASAQEHHPAEHSQHPDNKQKNRYLNIVAYDHTRVPLRPLPGQKKAMEYVNANYIDGYDKPRAYIGTQGPLPSTFDTFWRMVWEQRVHIIVMITNLVERGRKKCDQYWPKEGNEIYGLIQVRLVHEEVLATYTIRKLAIRHMKVKCKKSGSGERIVYQYHYTNWPDHGTPDHPLPVLSFVRKSAAANPEDAGPIIVHCSAGVGRTGTYIVLDAMLQQIRAKGRLNIWGFLKHIRTQRNFLVQTEEQYIFIHDALLEAIQSGDTNIPRAGLSRYIRMLQAPGGSQEKPQPWYLLSHQFKLVTHFQPRDFNVVSAVKPVNREKNRSTDHLPMENGRVHLTPKPGVEGSDYINATWLMGHQRLREFILTQHPMPASILDFWQMVWDHNAQTIVVLTAVDETQSYPQFWPAQHDDFDSEHWKVRYLEEKLNAGLVTVDVAVQSLQDDYELPVRLIHAPGWPHTLPALTTTLSLVSLVSEAHTNYQNGPLIVVDRFGGTEGATFCCLTALKNQVDFEQHLDPYMFAKLYHNRRPSIWTSQDDLLFIYRAMESYTASEGSHSGSSNDMAGLHDPVITMPPITTVTAAPAMPSAPSPVPLTSPPQTPSAATLPAISTPPSTCANGQVPSNGHATLTGNGTVRVPPEGMEDAPQATEIPPV